MLLELEYLFCASPVLSKDVVSRQSLFLLVEDRYLLDAEEVDAEAVESL